MTPAARWLICRRVIASALAGRTAYWLTIAACCAATCLLLAITPRPWWLQRIAVPAVTAAVLAVGAARLAARADERRLRR